MTDLRLISLVEVSHFSSSGASSASRAVGGFGRFYSIVVRLPIRTDGRVGSGGAVRHIGLLHYHLVRERRMAHCLAVARAEHEHVNLSAIHQYLMWNLAHVGV